jgi:hypothetical protein
MRERIQKLAAEQEAGQPKNGESGSEGEAK